VDADSHQYTAGPLLSKLQAELDQHEDLISSWFMWNRFRAKQIFRAFQTRIESSAWTSDPQDFPPSSAWGEKNGTDTPLPGFNQPLSL
jgi:hypothetical protein